MLHCVIYSTHLSIMKPTEWMLFYLDYLKVKNAWKVDVTPTTYDIYNPTIDTIRALCRYFNLEII